MDYGPDNTKLEKLMKDPQKQDELTEELRKSQLFLPVIFSENMFEGYLPLHAYCDYSR